jgi:hypothetical protein
MVFRYLCWQSLFQHLQPSLRSTFNGVRMLSYRRRLAASARNFGIVLEPRYIVGTGRLDQ